MQVPDIRFRSFAEGKLFTQDVRIVHVRDLNFILRSKIFVHWDGQLRVSHLILGVEPVYSTWQPFRQALLVDSPVLSYIDVWHANFLLPRLTIGEARDLSKRYTCSDELAPLQDKFVERASQRLQELAHKAIHEALVQEPAHPKDPVEAEAPTMEAEQFVINLPATGSFPREEMVTRKTMTIDHFVPDARQAAQPPPSQNQVHVPPPPPPPQAGQVRKRQEVADHPPMGSGDAVILTPPRPTGGIVIQEPQTQVGLGTTSSSQAVLAWKPKFLLDYKPLPSTTYVRMWEKGERGRIAQTLATGLLLPDDVHAGVCGT